MKQVFKSAISWRLFAPILVFLFVLPFLTWRSTTEFIICAAVSLLTVACILYLMRTTYYTLTPTQLEIRCGFWRTQVAIDQITKVTPTRNPLSAPAFSLDRLEIKYGKYDYVLISPADKTDFLLRLSQLNPAIQLPS